MDAALTWSGESPSVLGTPARGMFSLRAEGTFLNHGSYGTCPKVVQEQQQRLRDELERHPDAFFERIKPAGGERAPRHVAAALARLVNTVPERIALVENATTGIQAVLNSAPLREGDEILITDQQYNAVRLGVLARCRQTGATARIVPIPLPTSPAEITQRVLEAAGGRTRLAILDHITSGSALVLPLDTLVPELHRRGIAVCIDGAHAIGQLPLDIPAIGADWYISNAHKWLYAPRGSALLWENASAAVSVQPVLTSHYVERGFPEAFDYVGTRDYTAWLATPAAIAFFERLGPAALWQHEALIVDTGSQAVQAAGAMPCGPRTMSAAMRAFILPQLRPATSDDAETLMRDLWERERIQIRCAPVAQQLLLRFCAQAYVSEQDVTHLGEALQRRGWPARA